MDNIRIRRALISVYHKDGIDGIAELLTRHNVEIISTGGTYDYLKSISIPVRAVEEITSYPSILGGRVKTLHPLISGGILARRDRNDDQKEIEIYGIPEIDLVIVDLYPFCEYVKGGSSHDEIIEKIDIGGITLIRAAAKNFRHVAVIPCKELYGSLTDILSGSGPFTTLAQRARFAAMAFNISSDYDSSIFEYLNSSGEIHSFKKSVLESRPLRYGENPHQKALFFGSEDDTPLQLHGKEISYNNMLDIEAAIELISDFQECTVAILKHNNACGCASGDNLTLTWQAALACDPLSAYGGIIITNREIDAETARSMNEIFSEVVIAPSYNREALEILKAKKNRIILLNNRPLTTHYKFRSLLGGILFQERDSATEGPESLKCITPRKPDEREIEDLLFANKIVKHSKSNTIVLARDKTLLASGVGQTSRVDALKQAIEKAKSFGFELKGGVMASDAFFPFPDCVEIAHKEGIDAVIQPGGSIRDKESTDYCINNNMTMVITGIRHFKH
ncbi:MAG: bifunctional phosphoribosylaminoimidazolecarboxamide formyltransferase/IMP cyclohydrolase [Bacteroidales bacterium]|nr:bifunctional phosphoribosylaminoimidazolecarboxamide formyltransferase/IMP cyclohydrolase [Bacteroidales bacterium]MDD2425119.1 bifunctional phosphoribosylaminoimidazolecarboxamide formyltransferase/IMP cyclohydrolase [Bacteroidales bacterium]MDD3989460.1 bifunctional phosphoribosylaminoimidazolecarboxamide formyltransferase/IMP cyclohydrolase [Bacteroidales bacterium]MDD4639098.1 bifunctional phosphoribosylaminoimidazolecarboxamide formyltransferase/IMP cyclohydrolase [Bacteroidales bacteriu